MIKTHLVLWNKVKAHGYPFSHPRVTRTALPMQVSDKILMCLDTSYPGSYNYTDSSAYLPPEISQK